MPQLGNKTDGIRNTPPHLSSDSLRLAADKKKKSLRGQGMESIAPPYVSFGVVRSKSCGDDASGPSS